MFEEELERYEKVRLEYEQKIVAKMDEKHYREYSEVLFSTHSCAIEGNSFTLDDSKSLKELGLGMPVPERRTELPSKDFPILMAHRFTHCRSMCRFLA